MKDTHIESNRRVGEAFRQHPSVWWVGAVVAAVISVVCYFERQWVITFPGGPTWAQYIEMGRAMAGKIVDTVPEDVVLVEAAFDRVELPVYNAGSNFPIGTNPVTNRRDLLKVLESMNRVGGYRYVMLDISFAADIPPTESDSALFALIATMPRIVIPKETGKPLADPKLMAKARCSEYEYSLLENNFVKYPVIRGGEPSLALSMYEELTGDRVEIVNDYLAISQGHLTDACLPLHFRWRLQPRSISQSANLHDGSEVDENRIGSMTVAEAEVDDSPLIYLGDMAEYYDDEMMATTVRDKIVVIGGLTDGDIHSTYAGDISGALINYNAYRLIAEGRHRTSYLYLLFSFAVYYMIWVAIQCGLTRRVLWLHLTERVKRKGRSRVAAHEISDEMKRLLRRRRAEGEVIRTMLQSWIGIPLVLSICSVLTYRFFGIDIFNVFWPTVIFNVAYLGLSVWRWLRTGRKIAKLSRK